MTAGERARLLAAVAESRGSQGLSPQVDDRGVLALIASMLCPVTATVASSDVEVKP